MSEEGLPACPLPPVSTQLLAACGTSTGQAGTWHGHFQRLKVHLCIKQRGTNVPTDNHRCLMDMENTHTSPTYSVFVED